MPKSVGWQATGLADGNKILSVVAYAESYLIYFIIFGVCLFLGYPMMFGMVAASQLSFFCLKEKNYEEHSFYGSSDSHCNSYA